MGHLLGPAHYLWFHLAAANALRTTCLTRLIQRLDSAPVALLVSMVVALVIAIDLWPAR